MRAQKLIFKKVVLPFLLLIVIFIVYYLGVRSRKVEIDDIKKQTFSGETMGTTYNVVFYSADSVLFKVDIDHLLDSLNSVFSHYDESSEISRINRGEDSIVSPLMGTVMKRSFEIYESTSGAFDPTVSPLVERWGFAKKKQLDIPDSLEVDSLLGLVSLDNWKLEGAFLKRKDKLSTINLSAIAKGFAVDVLADYMKKKNVEAGMVEIGGEVVCFGTKPGRKDWKIGINHPEKEEVYSAIYLRNKSLATSGNYRNYYIKEGKKYAHTISPFSGRFVEHQLLSASVLADDCMTADAYATAFMVLGLEKSKIIVDDWNDLDAFFIFEKDGKLSTWSSPNFQTDLVK